MTNILAKLKELLGSRRFWLLTSTAIIAVLKLDPITLPELLTIVQVWMIGITAVGTIDSFGRLAGGSKK